jgi:hypothetical protein
MTDRVDDDFRFRDFVEDQKGIWRRSQTTNGRIIGADADIGISWKQSYDIFYPLLHTLGASR